MTVKRKIRRGDKVQVISGASRGARGEVLNINTKTDRVRVAGVQMIVKHQRQSPQEQGGRVRKEGTIHMSNLALIDPKTDRPTRVGYRVESGKKIRVAKRSGETINVN